MQDYRMQHNYSFFVECMELWTFCSIQSLLCSLRCIPYVLFSCCFLFEDWLGSTESGLDLKDIWDQIKGISVLFLLQDSPSQSIQVLLGIQYNLSQVRFWMRASELFQCWHFGQQSMLSVILLSNTLEDFLCRVCRSPAGLFNYSNIFC